MIFRAAWFSSCFIDHPAKKINTRRAISEIAARGARGLQSPGPCYRISLRDSAHGQDRQIYHQRRDRQGRHGDRLPRQRSLYRPDGGHQDRPPRRPAPGERQGRGAEALLARSPGGRQPLPSQHRHHLRCRRARRADLYRHGVYRRLQPGRACCGRAGHSPCEEIVRLFAQIGSRPGLCPRQGDRPPRHQAGQHPGRPGPQGVDRRFRHRPHRDLDHDPDRHAHGHAALHVARADRRQKGGQPRRYLFPGGDPV